MKKHSNWIPLDAAEIYAEGSNAHNANIFLRNNPYEIGSMQWIYWAQGWIHEKMMMQEM